MKGTITPTRRPEEGRPAAWPGRVTAWLSPAGGVALAALMVYVLAWGRGRPATHPAPDDAAVAAVFFPDRADWDDFRAGARAIVDRGLAKSVADGEDALTLEAPRSRRRLRFAWHGVGGVIETREEVRRLVEGPAPPVAVVGSANSVLTAALADALRAAAEAGGRPGPVLLVPWASAILVDDPRGGARPVPLLGIDPGRTFRFCANNDRLADLVVGCLSAQKPREPPGRAFLVVDRDDSFSTDLADAFARSIARAVPGAEVARFELAGGGGGVGPRRPDERFGPAERSLAGRLWQAALDVPGGRAAWVALPLQEEPTRRMIEALRGQGWYAAMGGEARLLRVLCGDGLRRETLQALAATHDLPFQVWAASSVSADEASPGAAGLGARQVPAEIVSALVRCLDSAADRAAADPDGLRAALAALDLAAGDPAALGRPLAFDRAGERRGGTLGGVLEIEPGHAALARFTPQASGRWVEAELPRPGASAAPP